MSNTFGKIFRVTTYGESHGQALGGVIDGMPAGIKIDLDEIQRQVDRRRPGQSAIVTARDEKDRVEILSGLFEGVTTGQPIGFIVRNANQHSGDYEEMKELYRPSHADYTYTSKYGLRDHRGGGRSSARETVSRVVAGAFAMQALATKGISIAAYTDSVGDIALGIDPEQVDLSKVELSETRCPDPATAERIKNLILDVKRDGDTIGGVVGCVVRGVPVGLGDPCFDKLQASLAAAMMSINAAKGFEYGMGFEGSRHRGSEMIDSFIVDGDNNVKTSTNHSGGIQGGISNGMPIYFKVAFKPVATLLREVQTIDRHNNPAILKARGRHDPCVVPRAVPVVEAMAAIVLLDSWLSNNAARM